MESLRLAILAQVRDFILLPPTLLLLLATVTLLLLRPTPTNQGAATRFTLLDLFRKLRMPPRSQADPGCHPGKPIWGPPPAGLTAVHVAASASFPSLPCSLFSKFCSQKFLAGCFTLSCSILDHAGHMILRDAMVALRSKGSSSTVHGKFIELPSSVGCDALHFTSRTSERKKEERMQPLAEGCPRARKGPRG